MVYSALLCNTLLALAGTADAAPSGEKRFNQPHFDPAHLHMPIRSVSRRVADPDPAVQVAYARDEAINHRIKYAARLDPETYEIHKRDLEFLESEQQSRKRAPGAVSLTSYNWDMGYAAEVKVGTPPQSFQVVVDTGSADMLLFSRSCADCSRHPTFDKSRSSTFKDRQTTAYNAYATGSATGRWVTDRVEMSTSYVNNQPFHLVEAGPLASYVGNEISGIMGLGPAGIAAQSPKGPIMETPAQFYVTAARTVWDQPEFGVFLKRTNTNPTQTVIGSTATEPTEPESGVITFGGINETYVSPDSITYMPANTTHWWQLPLEAIVINGRPLPASNVPTVIDTGATMNYFPFPICQIILDNVPRALHLTDEKGNVDGTFAIPCKSKFSLSFRFAGKDYALDSADLIRSRVPDGMLNRVGGNAQLSDYCMANFAAGSWLLGAAFMKNVYTVFRMSDPPSIGFGALTAAATQKNPSATGSGKGSSSGSASSLPKNSAAVGHKGLSARALTAAGVVLSLFV